ncbi:MAG: 4-hydroxybutyryl-CoA dehydratase [Deltaproteobacteria bacterium]|nr:4-hydroxybutyryl-CoA dehydratase [Deltaproteobacteria bacterium]
MKTGQEYKDSIRSMNLEIYIDGDKTKNIVDHPKIKPAIEAVAKTYDMANDPELAEQFITTSHFTGEPITRFQHVPQSIDDLMRKVNITRYCNRQLGMCSFRCIQNAFVPILYITAKMDKKNGTNYHHNFIEWIKYVQQNDLLGCPAITDPKGDRTIAAHEQPDLDMYLRVISKNKEGIILRGAKLHQTGAVFSHEKLVIPCHTHRPGDEDYAVICAVPSDAKGIIHVSVRHPQDDRYGENVEIDLGNIKYGVHECIVIFDDVFVPWERVFMCGEVEYLAAVINMFGMAHRPTTGGCKTGWADVLIAATELFAENQGLATASHVRDKITDMIAITETMYSCGIAASARGIEMPDSGYISDPVLANNTKYYASKAVYDLIRLAEDITGGILACCPSEKEMNNPEIAHFMARFLKGVDTTPAEDRIRLVRLIENISWGLGSILHSATHGGGSGQACKMSIAEFSKMEKMRQQARDSALRLCGIIK